ncbi:PQQ-binding-like beta-propeller repeat protein [Phaeobacter sp. HS012]|uniref:PQQ-like beta-propeller repeat protein n=1 Tax=unclassified Phaeobacter TaxID=2621772 RepID=UPI001B38ABDA|nr:MULTISPECIES: PQQ-binding-like beta-propeller repeat protein [unclassified Phaeobacter]MBQ4807329.1 PQQ-binding-like beta-propeller repeat protein [Phaeobacter sp. HS012]MBQ4882007.1 PQQ-binding-like beta-propeller repeat protein [Phaeobacter sp. HS011]
MMAVTSFWSARGILTGTAVALILSACAEPEVILRGERLDLRDDSVTVVSNETRAIALPATRNNASWPQGPGVEGLRPAHPALAAAPNAIWSTSIGDGDSRRQRITATPVVGDGRIYTLDSGAKVSAVSPAGALQWQSELLPASDSSGQATGGGLAYDGGVLYVSSGYGVLTALDAASGATIWRQELEATGSGQPTVRDGLVYLVAGDDTGWAVHAKDGRIAWQVQATPSPSNILGAPAPAVTSDLAIFAFGSGDLTATFRKGGLRRWNASVAGKRIGRTISRISDVTGAPVVSGNRMYVGNQSGRTAAFDLGSGDRLWTAPHGAVDPVWAVAGNVFLISDLGQLVRLDADSGDAIWATNLPGYLKDKPRKRGAVVAHHGPVLAGGQVVVASNDGLLRFFSPESGALLRSVAVPGGASTAPVVANGTLYVVSTKGELHAFR